MCIVKYTYYILHIKRRTVRHKYGSAFVSLHLTLTSLQKNQSAALSRIMGELSVDDGASGGDTGPDLLDLMDSA